MNPRKLTHFFCFQSLLRWAVSKSGTRNGDGDGDAGTCVRGRGTRGRGTRGREMWDARCGTWGREVNNFTLIALEIH